MPKLIDILGQEILVGDHVAYPTTSGRSPVLRIGTLEKLTWKKRPAVKMQTGPGTHGVAPYMSEDDYVTAAHRQWDASLWHRAEYGEFGPIQEQEARDRYHNLFIRHTFTASVRFNHEVDAPSVTCRHIVTAHWGRNEVANGKSTGSPTATNLIKVTLPEGFLDD